MHFARTLYRFSSIALINLATASPSLHSGVNVRNAPGQSNADTYDAVRRGLAAANIERRDTSFKTNETINQAWDGAVLLKFGAAREVQQANTTVEAGIEIVCTTCYIKGFATAELSIEGEFNISEIVDQTITEVKGEIQNVTEEIEKQLDGYLDTVTDNFSDGIDLSDFSNFELPTFNYSFDVDVPAIPECNLKFGFDELEMYVQLNTILSLGATYTLNLYSSNTPVGISVGKNLEFGVIFSVDLILSAEGEIDISSGFHLKLDDGVHINLPLFSNEIADINFNGGQFEFLPVTLESAGIQLRAILRIGAHIGLNIVTPTLPDVEIFNHPLPQFGGGIEAGIFANMAEFLTNVTLAPEDEDCKLQLVQEYSIALGAAAGATVAFMSYTYGPVAEVSTPVWFTTIASACAIEATATPTPTGPPTITASATQRNGRRQEDLETVTVSTEITHTGVRCAESTLKNCPVSLQVTSQSTETSFLTTVVPSGEEATFPQTISNITSTIEFGEGAHSVEKLSGKPSTYTPPPPPPTATASGQPGDADGDGQNDDDEDDDDEVSGADKKLVIGLSVGLGVPVLVAILAGVFVIIKRRRNYASVPKAETNDFVTEPYVGGTGGSHQPYRDNVVKKPQIKINVTESR
ncbi:hypothetical protein BS50DRAFT_43158 [Corynespora cassiicola Philippines]|uniref:Mid2 domain-containing protein n=1 Tax=Corynespora cassiicola Philippines TaxID=1448308 RepID=A0A2T2PD56_CORCC|nr:hypothetical protein BS50DRAFT_43158 [Corynespora cassiicola Philippines]